MKHKPKILIVHKDPRANNPNACHVGLGVTANNEAKVLKKHGIDAEATVVVDGYDLKHGLHIDKWGKVSHVVMCAPFFDTPFLTKLCLCFPEIQFSVCFHSNAGFLGVDKWAMGILGEQIERQRVLKNFKVATNSKKFSKVVEQSFGVSVQTLPNLYWLESDELYIRPTKQERKKGEVLKVGTFCAIRTLKNIPTAAFAAAILSRKLDVPVEFVIMKGREEDPAAEKIIEGIKRLYCHLPNVKLVEEPWREWEQFKMEVVHKMDILLQPSFTESFNNVTADGISVGVASVVGEAIDWVPMEWTANVDDANDMAEVAIRLLEDKQAPFNGFLSLVDHNKDAIDWWKLWMHNNSIFGKLSKMWEKVWK